MDINLDRNETLLLELAALSPQVRHILDGETYRLRLETDDVDSDSVLQECILALRDDLAEIGLYLTCLLNDLYSDLDNFKHVLVVLGYVFPNSLYPKLRTDSQIVSQLKNIVSGSLGNGSSILLFLDWLGGENGCYADSCRIGCEWLATRITNTELFDIYITKLLATDSTLGCATSLSAEDLLLYVNSIRNYLTDIYTTLDTLSKRLPEIDSYQDKIRKRFVYFTKLLLQPEHVAEYAWMRLTDPETLDTGLQMLLKQRQSDFAHGSKLYGAYYLNKNYFEFTPLDVFGIAIRCYVDNQTASRDVYAQAINEECSMIQNCSIPMRALFSKIIFSLYPNPK